MKLSQIHTSKGIRNLAAILMVTTTLQLTTTRCNSTKSETASGEGPAKVELVKENGKYQLKVDGEHFYIKGAGLEHGDFEALARNGGNALRTWRTDNGQMTGEEVLDKAHELGLMVSMGLEVGKERHGFNYDDTVAVADQLERLRTEVMQLKDHPALLMWGIGNELNLHATNLKVWDAVQDIAKMIHEVDPNHPTTTMLAGAGKKEVDYITTNCPDIDFLSFQLYGDIVNLPRYIEESGYEGAYVVSEWGATGHWEVGKTAWGQPVEQTSHEKAKAYHQRYLDVIASDPEQCIGSFVFLWGQKQERTPTWYGLFLESGESTETVDVMHYIWKGEWPENRTPVMEGFTIEGKNAFDNIYLKPEETFSAKVEVSEPDGDQIAFTWEIMKEVDESKKSEGGDFEHRPETVWKSEANNHHHQMELKAPEEPGPYRIFIYASDGKGKAATANIPIYVKP